MTAGRIPSRVSVNPNFAPDSAITTSLTAQRPIPPPSAAPWTRAITGSDADVRLLHSSRSWDDIVYRDELERLNGGGLEVVHTLTRSQPPGWTGYARRVDAEMLAEVGPSPAERPLVYVCGPTPFVEAAAEALVQLGHDPLAIKTERFGPIGG